MNRGNQPLTRRESVSLTTMQDVHSDKSLNGWLLTPATNLVSYLANQTMIAGLTQRTMIAAEAMPTFLVLAQKALPPDQVHAHTAIKKLIAGAATDAAFAADEIANGFNTIFSHHAVAMWGAVETTIEQTLVSHIRKLPDAAAVVAGSASSLNTGKLRTTTEREAKATIKMWEQAIKIDSAMGRSVKMLKAFDINISLSSDLSRELDEMSEIRNIIVHRAGFADERFMKKCPWTKSKAGDFLTVDRARLDRYISATHKFAVALVGGAVKSKHIEIKS